MTDLECRPPESDVHGPHWLRTPNGNVRVRQWEDNGYGTMVWLTFGREACLRPDVAYDAGFRYVGPCVPPEEEAFQKIEASPWEAREVTVLQSAIRGSSDYETETHALHHALDILEELHKRGWHLARKEGA